MLEVTFSKQSLTYGAFYLCVSKRCGLKKKIRNRHNALHILLINTKQKFVLVDQNERGSLKHKCFVSYQTALFTIYLVVLKLSCYLIDSVFHLVL